MASKKEGKLTLKKTAGLLSIISFFSFALIFSIKSVLAYYNTSIPLSILASTIGDFDIGYSDINIMIYKESGKNTNVFVKTYQVPALGYTFNDALTSCTMPCEDNEYGCKVTCDGSNCSYKYYEEEGKIDLESNHKITCKFYFNYEYSSDINVYVMLETTDSSSSTQKYNSKDFNYSENIPAYGYKYVGYTCDQNGTTLEYDPVNKKFIMEVQGKNTCYAYFEKYGSSNLSVNVYVQSEAGSNEYLSVDTIPINKEYELNTLKSVCVKDGQNTDASIEYIDGYINIDIVDEQVCNVYLDLK